MIIKSLTITLLIATVLLGCGDHRPPQSVENNAASVVDDSMQASSIASDSSIPENDFISRAYTLGYNDEKIARLREHGSFTDEMILNVESLPHQEITDGITSDNKYKLSGFWESGLFGRGIAYMYVKEIESGKITVLTEIQNTLSAFGLLDDKRMFASIVAPGGADYTSQVNFYKLTDVKKPYAIWKLPDSTSDLDTTYLTTTFHVPDSQRLVSFWYQYPKEESGTAKDTTSNYMATVLDYEGTVIKQYDTQLPLLKATNSAGIVWPYTPIKESVPIQPTEVLFELGGANFVFDVNTGVVALR